jgi:hypothetical protein
MLLQDLRLLRVLRDQMLCQDSSQLLGSLSLPKDLHAGRDCGVIKAF